MVPTSVQVQGSSAELPDPGRSLPSEPVGKVGLMPFNNTQGVPRAAGMNGTIRGYVVSHPALPGPLTVRRNGREWPAMRFTMAVEVTNSAGVGGVEAVSGRGKLEIFFDPEGVGGIDGQPHRGDEIEVDNVSFEAQLDIDTGTYMIRLRERAVSTSPFTFGGKRLKTPVGRNALDIMYGEFAPDLNGLAVASSIALPWLSPAAKLVSLSPKQLY